MSDCFVTRKERNRIMGLLGGMDLCDEDSVWNVGLELESFSILLRSRILENSSGGD